MGMYIATGATRACTVCTQLTKVLSATAFYHIAVTTHGPVKKLDQLGTKRISQGSLNSDDTVQELLH